MKEINPREGVDEVKCDLVFDPGQTIHVSLVDGKGKAVDGATVFGGRPNGRIRPNPAAHFDMIGFTPGDKRRIMIYHPQLRAGEVFPAGIHREKSPFDDHHAGAVRGSEGRAVDPDGIGVQANVTAESLPNDDFSPATEAVDTQPDGKFECVVPAGCQYDLVARNRRYDRGGVQRISVEAGKTIDVGDVKIRPRN